MGKQCIEVSKGVLEDFDKAEWYRKQIGFETACRLMGSLLDKWYAYALERGWTKAESVAEYANKDHGPFYTAAFLVANRL